MSKPVHEWLFARRWRLYAALVLISVLPLLLFLYAADRFRRKTTHQQRSEQSGPAADLAADTVGRGFIAVGLRSTSCRIIFAVAVFPSRRRTSHFAVFDGGLYLLSDGEVIRLQFATDAEISAIDHVADPHG